MTEEAPKKYQNEVSEAKEFRRNPPTLYEGMMVVDPNIAHEERMRKKRLGKYGTKSSAMLRRNMSPFWQANVETFIRFFKETKDFYLAAQKFKALKKAQGWEATTKYMQALMKDVREKLAMTGLSEMMLQESAEDLQFAREVALEKLAEGEVKPILDVVNTRNNTFRLSDYAKEQRVVNVNIDNRRIEQNNISVGKGKLDEYLAKLPEDKRDAIRSLAMEYRKDSKLPQVVQMQEEEGLSNT